MHEFGRHQLHSVCVVCVNAKNAKVIFCEIEQNVNGNCFYAAATVRTVPETFCFSFVCACMCDR